MAGVSNTAAHRPSEEESELRRGPWTVEEDTLLIHYIAAHGEGQWNLLAKQAGIYTHLHSLHSEFSRLVSSLLRTLSFVRSQENGKKLQIEMAELFKTRY